MRIFFTYNFFLILIFSCAIIHPQEKSLYEWGLAALSEKKLETAQSYFRKSIDKNEDVPSLIELAKIYESKGTISGRIKARRLLRAALWKEPENIECRMFLASLMEILGREMAFDEYMEIVEIDSTYAQAWYNLGRLMEAEFNEYNNSIFKEAGSDGFLSYEEYAEDDFLEAALYFNKAIKYDSLNAASYLHLGFLYEDAGKVKKGIPLFEKLVRIYPDNKDAHLFLGLLYYKSADISKSYYQYQNALILMPITERINFTFNSVMELLKPVTGENIKKMDPREVRDFVNTFWNASDPLFLTEYNERLLEHYSRVAYANLRFSLPDKPGWTTDRGEVILRYGQPISKVRYRPHINAGGRTEVMVKTDVWKYDDMTFAFEDQFMSGNFRFSTPMPGSRYVSQYPGDTQFLIDFLRKARFDLYDPVYNGPAFSVPFQIAQFKNLNSINKTDVYVSYAMKYNVDSIEGDKIVYNYKSGLFFKDKYFNSIFGNRESVKSISLANSLESIENENSFVNTSKMSVSPDSGKLAFELIRNSDQGVSSNHFNFKVRKFYTTSLDISGIVLASKISKDVELALSRNNINILPNPASTFTNDEPLYIYYEVYNLSQNEKGLGDFQQKITIKKADKSSVAEETLNSIMNVFGLGSDEDRITLSTNYQTVDRNAQIYLQLDMSGYEVGDYILTTEITDNVSGEETSQETLIKWR